MSEKIEFLSKINSVGNSIVSTINKNVKNILLLKKDDYIQLSIEKIKRKELRSIISLSKSIKFFSKIINLGSSIGFSINKNVRDLFSLKKDDLIYFSIEKINKKSIFEA